MRTFARDFDRSIRWARGGVTAGAWRAREGARARGRGAVETWENVSSRCGWSRGRGDEGARVDAPETRW